MKLQNLLKTVVFTCTLFCAGTQTSISAQPTTSTPIDATNFPDESFRTIVSAQADTDGDGMLSDAELQNLTTIEISCPHQPEHPWYGDYTSDVYDYLNRDDHYFDGTTIDVTGIEKFENLARISIHNADAKNIPFAKLNHLKTFELLTGAETALDFSDAPSLEEIDLLYTDLKSLVIGTDSSLKRFRNC